MRTQAKEKESDPAKSFYYQEKVMHEEQNINLTLSYLGLKLFREAIPIAYAQVINTYVFIF